MHQAQTFAGRPSGSRRGTNGRSALSNERKTTRRDREQPLGRPHRSARNLAVEDLTPEELDARDPRYPMLIAGRARKAP